MRLTRETYNTAKNGVFEFANKVLKTDTEYLFRGGSWALISRVGVSLILFVLSIIYARYLLKDTYGSYRYVMSIISIGGFLLLPGIQTAFVRLASRGLEGSYRRAIRLRMLFSTFLSLFVLGAAGYFFITGDAVIGTALLLAGILVPLERGTGTYIEWLIIKQKFRRKTIASIVEHAVFALFMTVGIGLIYTLSLSLLQSLLLMMAAFYLGHGIPKLFYLRQILREIPRGSNPEQEKIAIRDGLHLSGSSVLPIIANNLDQILLHALLGPVSLAIYSFAVVVPNQFRAVITTMTSISEVKIFSKKERDLKTLPRKLLLASIAIFLGVLLYILLAPLVYKLFFPRYIEAINLSRAYALIIATIPFSFLGSALFATGRIKRVWIHKTLAPIVKIILIFTLIPLFGIWGAVWAQVGGSVFTTVILLVLFYIRR